MSTKLREAIIKKVRGRDPQLVARIIANAKALGLRYCKHCGCTHYSPCFDNTLQDGCAWVSRNECSVCRPDLLKAKLKKAGLA